MVGLGRAPPRRRRRLLPRAVVDALERAILTFEGAAEQFDPKALRAAPRLSTARSSSSASAEYNGAAGPSIARPPC
jgi:hypothetical protein